MNETTARKRRATSLLFFTFLFYSSSAQTHTNKPPKPTATLTPASLSTRGLASADILRDLFIGDFNSIDFDRNDPKFNGIFDQYLVSYARRFGEALPENDRVMMTREVCNGNTPTTSQSLMFTPRGTPFTTTNVTGTQCSSWRTENIGFAKPVLYSAKKALDRQRAADAGRELSQMMSAIAQPNGTSALMAKLVASRAVADDLDGLVQQNGPGGPVLERFEQNLLLFAANRPGLRLDGKVAPEAATASEISRRNQDFTRLITDLVEDDAKNWGGFAKYVPGSVTQARITSTDTSGLPSQVASNYSWMQMFGRSTGTVTLRLTEGMPDCFFYSETSSVCHPANKEIVVAYSKGAYAK